MRKTTFTTAVLVGNTLLLVACGSGGADLEDGDAVETTKVSVVDNAFEPAVIEVSSGDTVTWSWEGTAPHDVDGGEFQSDVQTSGTFRHTFLSAGEYEYFCNIHPEMMGKVVVRAP